MGQIERDNRSKRVKPKQTDFDFGFNHPKIEGLDHDPYSIDDIYDLDSPNGDSFVPDPPAIYPAVCDGLLVCNRCGFAQSCDEVHRLQNVGIDIDEASYNLRPRPGQLIWEAYQTQLEEQDVIPRGQSTTPQERSGNQQQRGKKKAAGFRYLNVDMLTAGKDLATIVEARLQNDAFRNGEQSVVAKLRFKNEYLLWTLRSGNPNLEVLGDGLGDDETKWAGAEIHLFMEADDFDGKKWIRSEVVEQPKATKKSR